MRKNKVQIKLADHVILFHAIHPDLKHLCQGYLTEEEPEIVIELTEEDICFEREKSAREDQIAGIAVRKFSDGYLETLAAYRKAVQYLLDYEILLFHGSVVAIDGEGYLFTAKSGTGKSTHTRLWREVFGEKVVMINDDKPLLTITDEGVMVWGTPWDGKHRLSTNCSVPLRAICILERDTENHIELTEKKMIYPMMLQQTYRSGNPLDMIKTLPLLDKLIDKVDIFTLGCNMSPDAARTAYRGMTGKDV